MESRRNFCRSILSYVALVILCMAIFAFVGMTRWASAATATAKPESLEDIYERAKNEGSVVVYAPIAAMVKSIDS